jgi:DNA polymerase-1
MKYTLVSINDLPTLSRVIKESGLTIGLDTETTGLNCRSNKIITIQFGTVKQAYILDCREFYSADLETQELWKTRVIELINSCKEIVGHNLGFDFIMLYHHFNAKMNNMIDTMLQELIINGEGMSSAKKVGIGVGMEDTGLRYDLDVSKEEQKWWIDLDLRDEWKQPLPDNQLNYCYQDVKVPLLLHEKQKLILEEKGLESIAILENACIAPIAIMQYDGCYVDTKRWEKVVQAKKQKRDELNEEIVKVLSPFVVNENDAIYQDSLKKLLTWEESLKQVESKLKEVYQSTLTGVTWNAFKTQHIKKFKEMYPKPKLPKRVEKINLNSPKQMKIALNALGIPVTSTDKENLEQYEQEHNIIKTLLEWKKLDKLINSFGETFLTKVDIDGRIHPQYHQIGASTGRMSCSNPNWQQIPSHEDEKAGDTVRSCIVAEKGNCILTADFSNIELRILAEMSQDEIMLSLFESGVDLHSSTANMMFNLNASEDEIKGNKEKGIKALELSPGLSYRSAAKTINFGLMYGMSPISLAKTLKISDDLANNLFKAYFKTYPQVKIWLDKTAMRAVKDGYSLTVLGRKRFYDTSLRKAKILGIPYNQMISSYKRQAKNAPIQGTSADITKHALVILYKSMPSYLKIVACVHDEIVVEVPKDKASEASEILSNAMYQACKFHLKTVKIPPIEVTIADHWKK